MVWLNKILLVTICNEGFKHYDKFCLNWTNSLWRVEMTKKSDIFCKPWLKDLGGGGFLDFYGYRGKNQTTNRLIIAPQSFIKMCVCVPTLSRCAPYCQAWHLECQENFRTKKQNNKDEEYEDKERKQQKHNCIAGS